MAEHHARTFSAVFVADSDLAIMSSVAAAFNNRSVSRFTRDTKLVSIESLPSGQSLTEPQEKAPLLLGSYLEFHKADDCRLVARRDEPLQAIVT